MRKIQLKMLNLLIHEVHSDSVDRYLQEKAGAYFTEMWLVFVVVLLQVFEKLPLKSVDVFYVAEDDLQLRLSEHFRVFTALADVTLKACTNICLFLLQKILKQFRY